MLFIQNTVGLWIDGGATLVWPPFLSHPGRVPSSTQYCGSVFLRRALIVSNALLSLSSADSDSELPRYGTNFGTDPKHPRHRE